MSQGFEDLIKKSTSVPLDNHLSLSLLLAADLIVTRVSTKFLLGILKSTSECMHCGVSLSEPQ